MPSSEGLQTDVVFFCDVHRVICRISHKSMVSKGADSGFTKGCQTLRLCVGRGSFFVTWLLVPFGIKMYLCAGEL